MKKNINRLLTRTAFILGLSISAGGLLASCEADSGMQSQASEVQEGINVSQDPLGAIFKAIELGKDHQNFEDDLDKQTETDPVSFQDLIAYLPQSPRDWTAEKPKGQTSSFGDYSVSQVKQTYFQKDKTMTVSIFDWAFNSALYMPFLLSTEFSQESTEGYNKGIKIGNIPGRENYDYYTKDGSLNLLINRRFFVQIDGDNIEETELREWWSMIDSNSLSKERI